MPPAVYKEYSGCKVYACCLYDDIIKHLIRDLKYHNKKKLSVLFAKLMNDYIKDINLKQEYLIIPVPISKERRKERKYNHMELVSDELSKLTGFKNNKNLLIRIKDTEKQYKLHRTERIKNIKGAFDVNNTEISKETPILIIDDITSTGITLEENIKTLKKSGFKEIIAITLATPDIWN
ncbi:ComF family protein [bacterium]|nr:ComF family protein [bacterium]